MEPKRLRASENSKYKLSGSTVKGVNESSKPHDSLVMPLLAHLIPASGLACHDHLKENSEVENQLELMALA